MANLRVVDHYLAGTAGGCCLFCRASQRSVDGPDGPRREAVVATGVEVPYDGGEIALCESCGREIADLLSMVDRSALAEALAAVAAAVEASAAAGAERDAAFAAMDALRRADALSAERSTVVVAEAPVAEEPVAEPPAVDETARPRRPRSRS